MKIAYSLIALSLSIVLAGCAADDEHGDVRQWMQEASKDMRGRVPPLPELKPFPVVAYAAADLIEPFSPVRVVPEKRLGGTQTPDFDRPKEPLEAYPLETLKMVGILNKSRAKNRVTHALVRAAGAVHQVSVGTHLGQNFGVITAITETEIAIKELVQDPSGQTADWVERPMTLQLQEASPGKEGKR